MRRLEEIDDVKVFRSNMKCDCTYCGLIAQHVIVRSIMRIILMGRLFVSIVWRCTRWAGMWGFDLLALCSTFANPVCRTTTYKSWRKPTNSKVNSYHRKSSLSSIPPGLEFNLFLVKCEVLLLRDHTHVRATKALLLYRLKNGFA
ncbi:hypothetical protein EJ08DRAFT_98235 [Tothia fuscella]|uniref:Uncharacterized protein n=1 Tax=Tothia fuscella TaxID=1048955 RepID=A0A9P4TSL1_9PEZI|nr:hypothetical protein EJ08DRAFT_98235 [Tothia fuscella]